MSRTAELPEMTLVVGVDEQHVRELRLVWPTWSRYRPELLEMPLLLVCDGDIPHERWVEELSFLDHPNIELKAWAMAGVSQREKMLSGLIFGAAKFVNTPWYLNLDTDVVATRNDDWIQPEWFSPPKGDPPAIVASPWGYSKPANTIQRLDDWGDCVPGLNQYDRLDIDFDPSSSRVRHPRITGWCVFGQTPELRRYASYCRNERLPVPSQDTFLWYCAARLNAPIQKVRMKKFGWEHIGRFRKLKARCEEVIANPNLAPSAKTKRPPRHARTLIKVLTKHSSPPKFGAEVGVYQGETSAGLLNAFEDLHLSMIDPWAPPDSDSSYARTKDSCSRQSLDSHQHNKSFALAATEFAATRRAVIESSSEDASLEFEDASLDFVFIDGDHSYEGVCKDMELWWAKLKPLGLLCGHDYGGHRNRSGRFGVNRAVNEFAEIHDLDVSVERNRIWHVVKPIPPRKPVAPRSTDTSTIAVAACFFNPVGYQTIRDNFHRFESTMLSQGVNLWTVEIAFGEREFQLPPSDRHIALRCRDWMWQKEAGLNELVRRLPPEYDRVAWIDADIEFRSPNWLQHVVAALDEWPVVQCWKQATLLDQSGQPQGIEKAVAWDVLRYPKRPRRFSRVHPGFGWAARREFLDVCPLYDEHITGGGDALMTIGFMGWDTHPYIERLPFGMRRLFRRWATNAVRHTQSNVGAVDLQIVHLWHGEAEDRKYMTRLEYLREHRFDPCVDITRNECGLWNWSSGKPELHSLVRDYFFARRDDG